MEEYGGYTMVWGYTGTMVGGFIHMLLNEHSYWVFHMCDGQTFND